MLEDTELVFGDRSPTDLEYRPVLHLQCHSLPRIFLHEIFTLATWCLSRYGKYYPTSWIQRTEHIWSSELYFSYALCLFLSPCTLPLHTSRRPIPMKIDLTRSACRQTVPSTSKLGFGFVFMFLFLAVCFSRRIKM